MEGIVCAYLHFWVVPFWTHNKENALNLFDHI
jgi:hypothetical protein